MKPLVDGGGGSDFRVSFIADARGAELYSKRLPGFKIRLPVNSLEQPTRIFVRAITGPSTLRLMDGECQASKILHFSPLKFGTQIELDIPCIVPESRDHDVLVLMSSDRVSWRQIRANFDNEMKMDSRRVTLDHLPNYIGLYTRHRMTSLTVDGGGGQLPTHDDRARVHFPPGALTKLTTVMVQTFPVPAFLWPRGIKTGPIMTLEPRRRRFHANVDYHVAVPPLQSRGEYHCRLLCSISEGMNTTEWKDITDSVDINWTDHQTCVFMSNLSGRFWMVFFEKTHFAQIDHTLFIHYACQIYANAITPAYAVQVNASLTHDSEEWWWLEFSINCTNDETQADARLYEDHPITVGNIGLYAKDAESPLQIHSVCRPIQLVKFRPFITTVIKYAVTFAIGAAEPVVDRVQAEMKQLTSITQLSIYCSS